MLLMWVGMEASVSGGILVAVGWRWWVALVGGGWVAVITSKLRWESNLISKPSQYHLTVTCSDAVFLHPLDQFGLCQVVRGARLAL